MPQYGILSVKDQWSTLLVYAEKIQILIVRIFEAIYQRTGHKGSFSCIGVNFWIGIYFVWGYVKRYLYTVPCLQVLQQKIAIYHFGNFSFAIYVYRSIFTPEGAAHSQSKRARRSLHFILCHSIVRITCFCYKGKGAIVMI